MASTPTVEADAVPSKVCLLGAPNVGKTSLALRLARGCFPPAVQTPGITVLDAQVADGSPVSIWDVAGSCAIDSLNQAFLSRVDVVLAVASPDVADSVATAHALVAQAQRLHPHCRAAMVLNKSDLGASDLPLASGGLPVFAVSARDGRGVREALSATLARSAT